MINLHSFLDGSLDTDILIRKHQKNKKRRYTNYDRIEHHAYILYRVNISDTAKYNSIDSSIPVNFAPAQGPNEQGYSKPSGHM
jgi:hypothetical protein